MQIYHYDPTTFDLTSTSIADESPLEPGVFLIAADATAIQPPPFNVETHFCRFINNAWQVSEIPQPEPEPLPKVTLEGAKSDKLAALAAKRFGVETGGITINGITIKTDRESQATLTGAYVQVQLNPAALIDWKGSNGWTQIDKATVELLAGAVGTHVQQCFSAERIHSEAIEALTTIEAVETYNFETGWPV